MLVRGLLIALVACLIDQAHKTWMIHSYNMIEKMKVEVTDFFNLVMVWNYGVSFGMLNSTGSEYQPYLLSLFALTVVGVLIFWLRKVEDKWTSTAIGLVIGGAIGNTIDRFIYGAVADFFDFHYAGFHWPAFNFADSFIFIGVFMLVTEGWFVKKKSNE